jgi:hypothetical protein
VVRRLGGRSENVALVSDLFAAVILLIGFGRIITS